MRSTGRVESPFNLMVGVELSCNIGVEVSVEFFFPAAVKFVTSSEKILAGCPLRAKNRRKVLMIGPGTSQDVRLVLLGKSL